MIKFTATALIHRISPVLQISERFQKRELILDDSYDRDGNHYTNFVVIEFTGDRMAQLDNFMPGQRVNVEGLISGREYNDRIYNTVKGQTISLYQRSQQYPQQQYPAPPPAPIPNGYPQTAQQYQQPQQYPQQQSQYRQMTSGPQAVPSAGNYPPLPPAPPAPTYSQPAQYPEPSAPAAASPVNTQPQQGFNPPASPGVADLPFAP